MQAYADRYGTVDREAAHGRALMALRVPEVLGPQREAFGPTLPGDVAQRLRMVEQELSRSRDFAKASARPALDLTDIPIPPRPQDFGPPRPLPGADTSLRAGENGWGAMRSDPRQGLDRARDCSTPTNPAPMATVAPPMPTVAPQADTHALDEVKAKAGEAHAALDGLNTTVSPSVSMGQLDALIAKAREDRAALASIGSAGGGGAPAISGAAFRSHTAAPAGHIDV